MVNTEKLENKAFLEKSIQHLETKGFENIKADIEGYETPKTYLRKGSDHKITPDIVAEKNGRSHFFDISLKSEKETLLKSKWLFLETLSKMKSGSFRVITTHGHYKFTDTMLADIHLENKSPIKI
jgi:hypothetical protein